MKDRHFFIIFTIFSGCWIRTLDLGSNWHLVNQLVAMKDQLVLKNFRKSIFGGAAAFCITTLSITTLSITTLSITTLSITTLSIMRLFATLSITGTQYKMLSIVKLSVAIIYMLCWVSLCWVSLRWVSLRWVPLCWASLWWVSLCWVSWRLFEGVPYQTRDRHVSSQLFAVKAPLTKEWPEDVIWDFNEFLFKFWCRPTLHHM